MHTFNELLWSCVQLSQMIFLTWVPYLGDCPSIKTGKLLLYLSLQSRACERVYLHPL